MESYPVSMWFCTAKRGFGSGFGCWYVQVGFILITHLKELLVSTELSVYIYIYNFLTCGGPMQEQSQPHRSDSDVARNGH